MIPGCAQSQKPVVLSSAVVVDTAPIRCPKVRTADVALSKATVPAPDADAKDQAGKPAVSLGAMQRWVDDLETAVATRNRAIQRLNADKAACRGELVARSKPKTT